MGVKGTAEGGRWRMEEKEAMSRKEPASGERRCLGLGFETCSGASLGARNQHIDMHHLIYYYVCLLPYLSLPVLVFVIFGEILFCY